MEIAKLDRLQSKVPVLADDSTIQHLKVYETIWVGRDKPGPGGTITNRAGNGSLKEIVNGVILTGMALNAIKGGIDLSLDFDSVLSNVTTAFLLFVTYQAVDNARAAASDL